MDDTTASEAVVNAADRLFYGRGIQAVGMDEIRAAAGISLKRMYSLFPSKEAILAEVLRRRNEQWTAGILQAAHDEPTPSDKLLSIFDFLSDWFAQDDFRGCAFINSFGELGATAPLVADAARAHKIGFQRYVADLVSEAGAPPSLAPQIALLAEGAQTTAAISGSPDAATDARSAARTLLDAARAA
ncbi:TetR/AcrR family transcriptional regulator [Conyzicola nivalis]|uniref:TetR family transcriptional regulator n=1 Tax=Conyzicola nivalis TaxID=1477021 RepID=A0A916WJ50_9MICO|nr:TetR/AcrR family transcriptional regulator [Conyzicola nivalis]GGB02245.1 TetR family transcriptional regulator [Conyzicola nivalis]